MGRYINPFTDWGFKRLFGQEFSKDLLINFLNDLFEGEFQIKDVTFKDKEQPGDTDDLRGCIFDIYCVTDDDKHFIVEMQNRWVPFFVNRSIYYASKAFVAQRKKFDEAGDRTPVLYQFVPVYVVCIMNFMPKEHEVTKFRTDVALREKSSDSMFSDKLRFIYLLNYKFGKNIFKLLGRSEQKNEVLQIICATLLTAEEVTVHNIPDILDVNNLIQLMRDMGVSVSKKGIDTYSFQAANIDFAYLESDAFLKKCSSLRGSVMLVGPMVARFGKAMISKPGGDKIGRRRLDTHFIGIQNLGADFVYNEERGIYEISAKQLHGSYMLLDEASVTGTANIVMAAVLAKGKTTIYNAACEPYVQQLCRMLNRMGAKIEGIASNLLTIEGVDELHGTEHTILPDMIEVGSFIGMAAMTRSELTIKNVSYENLGIIPDSFRRLGIKMEQWGDDIYVPAQETYQIEYFIDGSIMTIADAPWPGLTPDLLSVLLVVATQAKGSVLIHQKMFESRLFFVDKLIDMGAQIILCDPHRAVVIGHDHGFKLRGGNMTSPDIRAGIALLIAAMSADGISRIHNIEQIDRGYQNIEGRLNALGARITRIE